MTVDVATTDERPERPTGGEWWRSAVVYQLYVRSFADSDGDGIGDLRGLTSRIDYLAQLGIDAVWLNPFYPSPLRDGGYDIVDHRDVDHRLGTVADFDELVERAHAHDIKIIVDIVPNHTSDLHPWFLAALAAGRGGPERDRYIFRDGSGNQPPSDWRSHFGGSAWDQVADGQWYCHLFLGEQPDLNWGNAEVRAYFRDTLRFWADRGVDGFRIDVAHSLAKDLSEPLRSQPHLDTRLPLDGSDPLYDREEVHTILPRLAPGLRRVRPTADGRRRDLAPQQQPHVPLRQADRAGPRLRFLAAQVPVGPRRDARRGRGLAPSPSRDRRRSDLGAVEP
jgi:alpha-glucosidase